MMEVGVVILIQVLVIATISSGGRTGINYRYFNDSNSIIIASFILFEKKPIIRQFTKKIYFVSKMR